MAVMAADTGAQSKPIELSIGNVESWSLPGAASDVFEIVLPAGLFLVSVEQLTTDVRVAARGEAIDISVNSGALRDDRETLLLDLDASRTVQLVVENLETNEVDGRYSIVVDTIEPGLEATGYRLMTEAGGIYDQQEDGYTMRAIDRYRAAIDVWRRSGNVAELARSYYAVAYIQNWDAVTWTGAIDDAQRARDLYLAVGNRALAANTIYLEASSLIEAATGSEAEIPAPSPADAETLYSEALQLFDAALRAQTELGRDYDRAQTLNYIGMTYFHRDLWDDAKTYWEQSSTELRALGETTAELNPLSNVGVAEYRAGKLFSAKETYARLLQISHNRSSWRADTLSNLAAALLQLGDTDGALLNYSSALALHQADSDVKGQGQSLSGIGQTYFTVGEYSLAEEYFERSLPFREKANDSRGRVSTLRSLAAVRRQLDDAVAARTYYRQALVLAKSPVTRAEILISLAHVDIDAGNLELAEAALLDARNVADSTGARGVAAAAALQTGRLLDRRGDANAGRQWLQQSHGLFLEVGMLAGQAESHYELAISWASEDPVTAIEYAARAVAGVESMRSLVSDLELRAVFLGTRSRYSELLIELLMSAATDAGPGAQGETYIRRAFDFSERARARATVDLINEAAVSLSIDAASLARQSELRERIVETSFTRDQQLINGDDAATIQQTVTEIQSLRTALDVLETEARRDNPRYATLSDPAVLTSEQVQAQLDDDAALLQYALGESSSYLWLVTSSTVRAVKLDRRATIDAHALRVYESLATFDPAASLTRQADIGALSRLVIGPVADDLAEKRVIVVAADGALHYLPFAILELNAGRPLLQSHDVVMVPSTTVIAAQRSALSDRAPPSRTIALVGDPVFSDKDARLRRSEHSVVAEAGDVRSPTEKRPTLTRLPFSALEVEKIAALVDEGDKLVLTGFDASKDAVDGSSLAGYRYVHLATHGIIDAAEPALSTIALSQRDHDGAETNGFLRLQDIYGMQLDADLVVLSACDTALGREVRGEGLIGLTQGFLYAGTSGLVASLWQVPDRATAELMTRFYRNLLQEGERPATALRNAQRELAETPKWRDPYFWAGFAVFGEWR